MAAIYSHRHTVTDEDMDEQGHVNNLAYLRWMQDAAVAHSSKQGWPIERYRQSGSGWVVRSHAIEYQQPAFRDDRIEVLTWVSNFKKIRSLRKYRILRESDGAVLANAETVWAFVGLELHVPRRIPSELLDAFEVVAAEDEPM